VGANDGFLHGFRALDGKEVVAYAPGNLFSSGVSDGYHRLTDPNFNHNNLYVDGTPFVSDAYIASTNGGSESWRTVLVGPQGGGGRGLLALDVTNPDSSSFREGNAANIVMWEFTNSDDAHLGYTQARPTIALLNNGRWAVLTGNGPTDTASDETGGESQLFILYLDGGIDGTWTYGTDYLRFPTGSGSSDARNALMTPAVIDIDGDGTADRVYAGDLNNNLWAFDLSSSDFGDWGIAHGSSPLFTGESSQPITAKPTVIKHPTQNNGPAPNLMILFGTGRFLSDNDKTRTDPQSFYGVWDTGIGGLTRADLVAQTFLLNDDSIGGRVTDPDLEIQYANATGRQYGWYIDLPTAGERVVSRALVRDDIVYFSTIIPDVSVCAEGGTGWEMAVKTENGGSPDAPVFDFNDDNEISLSGDTASITLSRAGDTITEDIAYGGRKLDKDKGMPTAPAIKGKRRYTASTAEAGKPKSTALEESAATLTGRLSWEQLFPSQ
jgi:type IV pilus assembly protein PilY1